MAFWATIASGRYAAGQLWLPSLSLDLHARDMSMITVPVNCYIPSTSRTINGNTDVDLIICYPESWALDQAFAPMLARVTVQLLCTSGGSVVGSVGFVGATATSVASGATDDEYTITRDYTTLPTGATTEQVRLTRTSGSAGQSIAMRRDLDSHGPACSIELVEV